MRLNSVAVYACASLALASSVRADDLPGTVSPRCTEITDRVVRMTGAKFQEVSKDGFHVSLRHPLAKQMTLDCAAGFSLSLFVASNAGAFPPASFYQLAGVAGAAVTKRDASSIRLAAERMHLAALKEKFGQADVTLKNGVTVGSTALTSDGGFTSISVSVDQ